MSAFSYNGVDYGGSDYGVVVLSRNWPFLSTPRVDVEMRAGADGAVSWGGYVGPREWRVRCVILADDGDTRLTRARNVALALEAAATAGECALIFDDDPTRQYQARLTSGLDAQVGAAACEFELTFIAPNPAETII